MGHRRGKVRTRVVTNRRKTTLHGEIRSTVSAGAAIYTDELRSYDGLDARSIVLHAVPTLLTGYLPTRFCRDCRLNMWADGVMPGRRQADRAQVRVRRAVR